MGCDAHGRTWAADFDVIDRFLVAHGLDLAVAGEAMALEEVELAHSSST